MRAFSRRNTLTAGLLLGALMAGAPSPGPVQADDPRHSRTPGQSLYRYDGDGRLDRVERRREGAVLRYDRGGAVAGADRRVPRTRPRDGRPPDRPRPAARTADPFAHGPIEDPADVFTYDGDGDLTGAARRFPNLPDARPAAPGDPDAPARK